MQYPSLRVRLVRSTQKPGSNNIFIPVLSYGQGTNIERKHLATATVMTNLFTTVASLILPVVRKGTMDTCQVGVHGLTCGSNHAVRCACDANSVGHERAHSMAPDTPHTGIRLHSDETTRGKRHRSIEHLKVSDTHGSFDTQHFVARPRTLDSPIAPHSIYLVSST